MTPQVTVLCRTDYTERALSHGTASLRVTRFEDTGNIRIVRDLPAGMSSSLWDKLNDVFYFKAADLEQARAVWKRENDRLEAAFGKGAKVI